MSNRQFTTFDKNNSALKTIKEESFVGNVSVDYEIRYLSELKYLIEKKVEEINQESKKFSLN